MNFSTILNEAIEKINRVGNNVNIVPFDMNDELPKNYNINENPELKKTYDYIRQNIPVIFLTGGAGTGKSTFIKYLKNNLKSELNKNCIVLAPTGVAAVNIGGQTIHSFFGFKTDVFESKEIKRLKKNPVLDHTDLIIIDEISMVPSWMIDHIDYALKLWCDKSKPFGGKQMLLIGDCFQLPPILDGDKAKQKFFERWKSPFFFAGKVFKKLDVKAIQLKKIYRQEGDEPFIHMLNRIRRCEQGYEKDIDFLNSNCFIETRLGTKNVPEECLLLTTKNRDAEKFNTIKMLNLKQNGADFKTFEGFVNGNFNFKHFLTPQTLELCIGAKVMVTKNITGQALANGDMGKVTDFGVDDVEVEIKGKKYRLGRETWNSIRYEWDENSKTIKQITEGSFSQIPLKLGWAVTIHKSQGLTLDAIVIDACDAWDSGQVYVALSRAKTLNGILLRQKIPPCVVKANKCIKHIYNTLFPESKNEDKYNENDYKNITIDNSMFTIEKTENKTSVVIGGINFELYPKNNEKIQDHVKRTMDNLLSNNLIPKDEMKKLLTDKDYCYNTFGICFKHYTWKKTLKFTLLRNIEQGRYDDYDNPRYWAKEIGGYYICSQWYKNCATKFAKWLIKLSEMKKTKRKAKSWLIKKRNNNKVEEIYENKTLTQRSKIIEIEEKNKMTKPKDKAINLLQKKGLSISNPVTFASKNKTVPLYWANPKLDFLDSDWWLILNNWEKKTLYAFFIPANSISKKEIVLKSSKPNLMDIKIDYDNGQFRDTRSNIYFQKWLKETKTYLEEKQGFEKIHTTQFTNKKVGEIARLEPPKIYFYHRDRSINESEFKALLLQRKRARRTWFYIDRPNTEEIWNASNFSETSDLMANIKTNPTYKRWKAQNIIKVEFRID